MQQSEILSQFGLSIEDLAGLLKELKIQPQETYSDADVAKIEAYFNEPKQDGDQNKSTTVVPTPDAGDIGSGALVDSSTGRMLMHGVNTKNQCAVRLDQAGIQLHDATYNDTYTQVSDLLHGIIDNVEAASYDATGDFMQEVQVKEFVLPKLQSESVARARQRRLALRQKNQQRLSLLPTEVIDIPALPASEKSD